MMSDFFDHWISLSFARDVSKVSKQKTILTAGISACNFCWYLYRLLIGYRGKMLRFKPSNEVKMTQVILCSLGKEGICQSTRQVVLKLIHSRVKGCCIGLIYFICSLCSMPYTTYHAKYFGICLHCSVCQKKKKEGWGQVMRKTSSQTLEERHWKLRELDY